MRMEWVASSLPLYVGTGHIQLLSTDPHFSAASSRLNWHPRRFKWTRPFRWKTKSGFCACAITFRTCYTPCNVLQFKVSPPIPTTHTHTHTHTHTQFDTSFSEPNLLKFCVKFPPFKIFRALVYGSISVQWVNLNGDFTVSAYKSTFCCWSLLLVHCFPLLL